VFLNELLLDYQDMLQKELEYIQGEEYAKEIIEANNYLFYADGTIAPCVTYTGDHEKAGTTELNFHGEIFTL